MFKPDIVVSAVAIEVFLRMSGQRGSDRVGQGSSRPADQAAQVTGVGEQLAAAQAKVGVARTSASSAGSPDPASARASSCAGRSV
jgi:hypothetical protein